jgi:hypothetical protein
MCILTWCSVSTSITECRGDGSRQPILRVPKNLIFHPLDKYSYHSTFPPIPSLLKGRCRDACSAGRDAAPAGVGVVPCAPGGPWVTVRAHYGAPPSMAGRVPAKGGETCLDQRACSRRCLEEPVPRSKKSPRRDAERRCRVPLFPGNPGNKPRPCYGAPFGVPPPSPYRGGSP